MPLTIDERLRLELERTGLRKIARTLKDREAWERAVRIMNAANRLRARAKDRYDDERERRVAAEQRRLVHAAGSRERHLVPPWAAADRFDPVRTREQAERTVRGRHERLMERIDRMEVNRIHSLVKDEEGWLRPGLPGLFDLNARPKPGQGTGPDRKGPNRD